MNLDGTIRGGNTGTSRIDKFFTSFLEMYWVYVNSPGLESVDFIPIS